MKMEKIFNPAKYQMAICKYCNGHGYVYYPERRVCPKCEGFGLIKQEEEGFDMDSGRRHTP